MNKKQIEEEFKNFTYNMRKIREKNNLSLNSMAQKLNISEGVLMQLEKGEFPEEATVGILFLIHKKFGILPKDMFGKIIF